MNSDEKRLLRHLESYNLENPTLYTYIYSYYSPNRLADRVLTPGFLIPLALLAALLYHHFSSETTGLESLPTLLWDALVRLTPARLLYAVDRWLNPPLFPVPMLQTQSTRSTSHAAKSEVLRRVLGMDKPGGIMASVSQAGRRSLSGLSPSAILKVGGDPDRPPGLGNISNSCYQNSVLQGLASLRPLRTYLASVPTVTVGAGEKRSSSSPGTVETLRELVADLNNPSNNGRTLWTPSVLKSMSTWQQQDAQEYFSKLLDEVDREVARLLTPVVHRRPAGFEGEPSLALAGCGSNNNKDDTVASQHSDDSGYQSLPNHHSKAAAASASEQLRLARNPLEGLQAQRVACTACGHSDGLSMIPFNCLTLNLGTDGREHDLYERLDSYTRVEPIPGVECAKCTLLKYRHLVGRLVAAAEAKGTTEDAWPEPFARLRAIDAALEEDDLDDATLRKACKIRPEHKVSSTKTKQAVVARPPQSLVVHVNRSVFDERTGRMWKNPAAVRFPTVLDLGPWCLGSAAPRPPHASRGDDDEVVGAEEEQWLLGPGQSMVAGAEGESRILGPMYELRAVITHHGRHENGHYVCYRRYPKRKGEDKPAQLAGGKADVDEEVDGIPGLEGRGDTRRGDDAAGLRHAQQEEEGEEEEAGGSQWWRLSDQDVTKVEEETVLAQSGVFMLFYDCVDPNSILTSQTERFVDSASLQDAEGGQKDEDAAAAGVAEPAGPTVNKAKPVLGGQQNNSGPAPSGHGETEHAGVDAGEVSEECTSPESGEDSGENSSGELEEEPEADSTEASAPVEEQKPKPLTRAEMVALAKKLFAKTAERAATVPLPDEDEDL